LQIKDKMLKIQSFRSIYCCRTSKKILTSILLLMKVKRIKKLWLY